MSANYEMPLSIYRTPAALDLVDEQVESVMREIVQRAQSQPEWRFGKALSIGFQVEGVQYKAALDHCDDHYDLYIGLPDEVVFNERLPR